jgi:hypothetical protein
MLSRIARSSSLNALSMLKKSVGVGMAAKVSGETLARPRPRVAR